MTWLTPLTGLLLAAAVIPPLILLYFLKLRRRPSPISSTLLWKRSIEDLRANAPFQKLRRSLLLLLQFLALVLLVLAVMQPQFLAAHSKGGRLVLLIDNSASMTATDTETGATRLDDAKRLARQRIEGIYGGGLLAGSAGETMIIAFADRAEVAARFTRSKQELLSAIDRIEPTHGRTLIGDALKLARAYTTNVDPDSERPVGEPADLEIFSDGRIADLGEQVLRVGPDDGGEGSRSGREEMIYHRIGLESADNLGMAAISVERPFDRPDAVEVFAALLNYNTAESRCDVELSVDGAPLRVEEIALPAAQIHPATGQILPGRNNVVFTPFEQTRGAVIQVAVLREDALAADDAARVVVAPPKKLRVALVAARSFLVRSALEGLALERLETLTTSQYEQRAAEGGLEPYDVIVFDDYAPPAGLMPPGRYLTFGATPPVPGLNEFGRHEAQIVLDVREEHPALRFVRLDHLFIAECRLLQPAEDVEVLVEGSQGPLLVEISNGPLHVLHVPFDPLESNWPFQRSWVTFVFNAVEYLGHLGEGLTSRPYEVGEAIATRLPPSAEAIVMRAPDGPHPLDPADPSSMSWGPIRLAGLHRLEWRAGGEEEVQRRDFAVNLLDEQEAQIGSVATLQVGQKQIAGLTGAANAYTPLWPWALGLCLAVLTFEWWVYHRKAYL